MYSEARQALLDVVGPFVDSGQAEMQADPLPDDLPGAPTITVTPARPGAAPLELSVDGALVSLAVGPHKHVLELAGSPDDWEQVLRQAAAAVVEGRYVEERRWRWFGPALTMVFELPTGPMKVRHAYLDWTDAQRGRSSSRPPPW